MTQNDRVLELLRSRGIVGIQQYADFEVHGCGRLAARIGELREMGYDIRSDLVRTSGGSLVARYVLVERPVQLTLGVAS